MAFREQPSMQPIITLGLKQPSHRTHTLRRAVGESGGAGCFELGSERIWFVVEEGGALGLSFSLGPLLGPSLGPNKGPSLGPWLGLSLQSEARHA